MRQSCPNAVASLVFHSLNGLLDMPAETLARGPNDPAIDPASLLGRFGLQAFRPGQRDVVDALAAGKDVLCVMPTGGGKSLC